MRLKIILQFSVARSFSRHGSWSLSSYSGGPTDTAKYDAGSVWLAL
jgi:hypothetical protein